MMVLLRADTASLIVNMSEISVLKIAPILKVESTLAAKDSSVQDCFQPSVNIFAYVEFSTYCTHR